MKSMQRLIEKSIGATILALLLSLTAYIFTAKLDSESLLQTNKIIIHKPYVISETASNLHQSLLISDWHIDSLMWSRDLLKHAAIGQADIPRLEQANMAVQVFTSVTKVTNVDVSAEVYDSGQPATS